VSEHNFVIIFDIFGGAQGRGEAVAVITVPGRGVIGSKKQGEEPSLERGVLLLQVLF